MAMSVGPASASLQVSAQQKAVDFKINWKQFPLEDVQQKCLQRVGYISVKTLKGKEIFYSADKEARLWEYRKLFIQAVVTDILAHCPKDEPLTLISLGSNNLLLEYIIGKTLLDQGYRPSFLLVDISYKFSSTSQMKKYQETMHDFKERFSADYHRIYGVPLPENSIMFLSRAQNIKKYFKPQSNVALIESPPLIRKQLKSFEKIECFKSPQQI